MGGTWSNSFELLKSSWRVLREHKSLVAFPIISTITTVVMMAALLLPAYFLTVPTIKDGNAPNQLLYYLFFFIFYFLASFIVIFFNTGLIACATQALKGQDPDFAYGFDVAKKNIGKIAGWALVSATVGLILKAIRERAGIIGQIAAGIIGFAWNLIVFFVIPVFVFQGFGVIDSIKESASLFRRTWGENMVARFSLGIVFFLLGLLGIVPIVLAAMTRNAAVIIGAAGIALAYWIVLAVLSASLNGILAAAMYQYAITGQVPSAYNPYTISGAFQQRQPGRFGMR